MAWKFIPYFLLLASRDTFLFHTHSVGTSRYSQAFMNKRIMNTDAAHHPEPCAITLHPASRGCSPLGAGELGTPVPSLPLPSLPGHGARPGSPPLCFLPEAGRARSGWQDFLPFRSKR